MKKAKITFFRCIQNSQEYGSDDEHMISRISFELQEPNGKILFLHSNIKQTVGSDFEAGPLEVSLPDQFKESIDYGTFRNAAEQYYRSCVGKGGKGINIQGGKNIRMYNNTIDLRMTCEVYVSEPPTGW